MNAVFTIFFEDPFWVGVLESDDEGRLTAARHVFGAEPTNAELLEFMLYRFHLMPRVTAGEGDHRPPPHARGAKRALREATRSQNHRVSTKAQEAIAAAREAARDERRLRSREDDRIDEAARFRARAEKRKRRHRGH